MRRKHDRKDGAGGHQLLETARALDDNAVKLEERVDTLMARMASLDERWRLSEDENGLRVPGQHRDREGTCNFIRRHSEHAGEHDEHEMRGFGNRRP